MFITKKNIIRQLNLKITNLKLNLQKTNFNKAHIKKHIY